MLLLLEHISISLAQKANTSLTTVVWLSAIMLSIHALFEGAAVGVAINFATPFVIVLAILAHKGAESFALATHLNSSSKLSAVIRWSTFIFFVLMTPTWNSCW